MRIKDNTAMIKKYIEKDKNFFNKRYYNKVLRILDAFII